MKMPDYRRYYIPDAIYFVTLVTRDRHPLFADSQRVQFFLDVLHEVKLIHPFDLLAYCVLPDHTHLLIKPKERANISTVIHSLKRNFTINLKKHDRGNLVGSPWQERFWDHLIRDEKDLARHLDYIHYNPVKHRLVDSPGKYVHSSYQAWLEREFYEPGWGRVEPDSVQSLVYE